MAHPRLCEFRQRPRSRLPGPVQDTASAHAFRMKDWPVRDGRTGYPCTSATRRYSHHHSVHRRVTTSWSPPRPAACHLPEPGPKIQRRRRFAGRWSSAARQGRNRLLRTAPSPGGKSNCRPRLAPSGQICAAYWRRRSRYCLQSSASRRPGTRFRRAIGKPAAHRFRRAALPLARKGNRCRVLS